MSNSPKLVDISEARKEKQAHIKREYERFLFKRLLGCYTVIEKLGLKAADLVDISKSGCSFQMKTSEGMFHLGEEMDLRLYFSNTTFLPARIKIARIHKTEEFGELYYTYGCEFDPSYSSHPALLSFVDFVEQYSVHAREDKKDAQVWFL